MDFNQLAKSIITNVGGAENVNEVEHCSTRLRFNVKDASKIEKATLKELEGVAGVVDQANGVQVIIGTEVSKVFEEIKKEYTFKTSEADEQPADSNMNEVYYSAGEYTQDLLTLMESNIKEDRTDLDLLFGCLLEWGLPLSLPYTSEQVEGCTIHTYNEGDLIACFDENIPDSVIKMIAKRQPLRAVFRDSSFNGSPAKINVGEIFKMLAPDTRVKVI